MEVNYITLYLISKCSLKYYRVWFIIQIYKNAARKIKCEILEKELQSEEHLCSIAKKMGNDWKEKFYLLGLENSDKEDIICDIQSAVEQR